MNAEDGSMNDVIYACGDPIGPLLLFMFTPVTDSLFMARRYQTFYHRSISVTESGVGETGASCNKC